MIKEWLQRSKTSQEFDFQSGHPWGMFNRTVFVYKRYDPKDLVWCFQPNPKIAIATSGMIGVGSITGCIGTYMGNEPYILRPEGGGEIVIEPGRVIIKVDVTGNSNIYRGMPLLEKVRTIIDDFTQLMGVINSEEELREILGQRKGMDFFEGLGNGLLYGSSHLVTGLERKYPGLLTWGMEEIPPERRKKVVHCCAKYAKEFGGESKITEQRMRVMVGLPEWRRQYFDNKMEWVVDPKTGKIKIQESWIE